VVDSINATNQEVTHNQSKVQEVNQAIRLFREQVKDFEKLRSTVRGAIPPSDSDTLKLKLENQQTLHVQRSLLTKYPNTKLADTFSGEIELP
jgi:hypothetical protein